MYQLYNLVASQWQETGKPIQAPSRRNAINYIRGMGHKRLSESLGVAIEHLREGTFKVVKV